VSSPGGHGAWRMAQSMGGDPAAPKPRLPRGTVRRVAAFAKPWHRILLAFIGLTILGALLSVANPLLYREIIDRGILGGNTRLVVILAVVVAVIAIGDALRSLVQRWISAQVGEGLIYELRVQVFTHVQRMPIAFFNRTQTGALVSRLNSDVLGAQSAFTNVLSSVVSNLVTVAATVIAMAVLSWQITVASLVLLPVFVLPARRIARRLGALTRTRYDVNAEMTTTTTGRFDVAGAMLVKLFGNPDRERADYAGQAGRVRDLGVQTAMYGRAFSVALLMTSGLATALVYGWGGASVIRGEAAVGTVVALTALLNRLYGPLTALSTVNSDVTTALVSFDRVFEVLDLAPAIDERPGARAVPDGPVAVQFDGVTFAYPSAEQVSLASLESVAVLDHSPRRDVLHSVSFTAPAGQLVALVGPSGAGKTTISALVPRLYDVDSGTVRLAGLDVRDATLASLRQTVGVVAQDPHLFHDTIGANLRYARPDATNTEIADALTAARADGFVGALPDGLDTVVGDRGYRLSGGEKQRIAIARLLLHRPRVVVLDEATAHLDSESEAAIQAALAVALRGRTSLVIAHRLSTIRDADLILVVADGRIVQRGNHEQLLAMGGLYADLYATQFAGQQAPA